MDVAARWNFGSVAIGAGIRDETMQGLGHPHLQHLGTRGKAHLEAGDPHAARLHPTAQRLLHGIGVTEPHLRIVGGQHRDRRAIDRRQIDPFGQCRDRRSVQRAFSEHGWRVLRASA
jgi:hypothetical protein